MKSTPREASLLRSCEKILTENKVTFRKRHGTAWGVAGDPDLYLCWRGRHGEIELKRPGEEPTKLQRIRMKEWEAAGALVAVVRSTTEMREFLLRMFAPQ